MSHITEELDTLRQEEKQYVSDLEKIRKRIGVLQKAINCDHDWETIESCLYYELRCKRCGYTTTK